MKFEETLSEFLNDSYVDQLSGGLGDEKQPRDFAVLALLEGMVVESEHTDDLMKALEITIDHLSEDLGYYKKLKTIEDKPKKSDVEELVGVPAE